jgi:hypothetical protein
MRKLGTLILLTGGLIAAAGTRASAQSQPSFAQVVALDECDPVPHLTRRPGRDLTFAKTSRWARLPRWRICLPKPRRVLRTPIGPSNRTL